MPTSASAGERARRRAELGRVGAEHRRGGEIGRERPDAAREQRDVDGAPATIALARVERRRDAAGQEHARRDVALRGPLHHHARRAREHVAEARARPERDGVVAARLGVGALRALAVSARVDQARIDREQVGRFDAELPAHLRQLIGDEHVGPGDEPLEHGPALGVLQVQADVALVAVHLLDEEVEVAGLHHDPLLHHRAQGIALGPLDLHHVRAPVGEHGRPRRHEALLGDLEHPHSRQHIGHGSSLLPPDLLWTCHGVLAHHGAKEIAVSATIEREARETYERLVAVRDEIDAGDKPWSALADFFTEDAVYIDPAWGRIEGRESIRDFFEKSMAGLTGYGWSTPENWIMVDGHRVVCQWDQVLGERPDGTPYLVRAFRSSTTPATGASATATTC